MPDYRVPGTYVREVERRRTIEPAASVTAFVGACTQGPVGTPVTVTGPADYHATFGPSLDASRPLGHAVEHFFANGGRSAVVVRAAGATPEALVPEDGAEQELPAHYERAEPLLVDQRVVVGIIPLLIVGVTVLVGVGRPEVGADLPLEGVGKPVAVAVRVERIALDRILQVVVEAVAVRVRLRRVAPLLVVGLPAFGDQFSSLVAV